MDTSTLTSRSAALARLELPVPFSCTWANVGAWANVEAGASWVEPVGELDLATALELEQALETAQENARLVVLDLRKLTFISSAGLHLILDADIRARVSGGRLIVVRGTQQIETVFARTNTSQNLEMFDLRPGEPAVQVLLQLGRHGMAA